MLNTCTHTYNTKDGLHSRSQNKLSLQDSMWTDLKCCKPVPRRGRKVYKGGKDQLVDPSFQWDSTGISSDTENSCCSVHPMTLCFFFYLNLGHILKQLDSMKQLTLTITRKTDRFPEVEGTASRKLIALAQSHTEHNSLFPVALHVTGGPGFWFVAFFFPPVDISGLSCMGNIWTQPIFQGNED